MSQTQWIVVGVGAGAFVLGVVFIIMGVLARRKLSAIKETPTVNAAQAAQMSDPSGIQRVELFGVAESATPLTSPATGTPCLYYKHNIEERRTRTVTDTDGYTHTEDDWTTVVDNKMHAPFAIRDESGVVGVVPDGADFVAQQTMNDQVGSYGWEPPGEGVSGGGILGQVLDTAMDMAMNQGPNYYRTSEWVIPLGRPVYVLGNAFRTPAGVEIHEGDGPFIVSHKSEEGLTTRYSWHLALWTIFGVLFGAGGIAVAIYGAKYLKK